MDLFNQKPTIGPDKGGIPRSLQEQLIERYGSLDNVPQTNFQQPSLSSLGADAPNTTMMGFISPEPINLDQAGIPNFGPRTVNGENISLDDFIGKSEITNFLPDAFSPSTPDFKIKDPTTPLPGGGTPFNNPIAPMPSPITPPPNMNSSHSHDDLLKGIGDLFKQYFPNQGSNFNQSTTQPMFDAVGNSAPAQQTTPQVFGNMITPFGRQS